MVYPLRRIGGRRALRAEVRQMQKAVLACIQCAAAAAYDNEVEADLADAVAAVRAIITAR